ncbi:spermatogenesis-associated protein 9 [Sphaerodactylus townsendi]|uniref:spermatogenesis-associated protein 9 n=1 Tax=Sphaerodactylus townsendi TaxID=933632 RepID=UPI002026EF35|nr:spermatogenesis-associated protein 9 [Sphaerodactylus townsendi]
MALRPIGWICGELVRKFAGQAEIIQRAFLEIIDEIRDEFPNLLRLTSSNQQAEAVVQESESGVAKVFSSAHGTAIINGLNKLSRSSKSMAKLLQPRLAKNFAELNMISSRLLKNINAPKQPMYKMKDRKLCFYDVISYPAKTALTGVMCASYAALIYLAIAICKILEKLKRIVETEKPSREGSSNGINGNAIPRAAEAASSSASSDTQQAPSKCTIKASKNSRSIYTLHSALDSENGQ